jgi:hypothetical protein
MMPATRRRTDSEIQFGCDEAVIFQKSWIGLGRKGCVSVLKYVYRQKSRRGR